MAGKKQTRGSCVFCGREMAKGGLSRHLKTCKARQEVVAEATQKPGAAETIYHLQVQDTWNSDYWLHLEMRGSTALKELDRYLRAIWLECCGHLSMFSIGGWGGRELSMNMKADRIFEPGLQLIHIYDYGTSSETAVKVTAARQGKAITRHPIVLMARNQAPELTCMECDRPATQLCLECLYEYEATGALCDQHARKHPHDAYGDPMPLVNSPRVGMCGYTGPADPPY